MSKSQMILEDALHAQVSLREPVLVDLVESDAVQRLKTISMGGIAAILGASPPTARFEHSIGAMLLVRRLGGSIEEQAAALLHDVSHNATFAAGRLLASYASGESRGLRS